MKERREERMKEWIEERMKEWREEERYLSAKLLEQLYALVLLCSADTSLKEHPREGVQTKTEGGARSRDIHYQGSLIALSDQRQLLPVRS